MGTLENRKGEVKVRVRYWSPLLENRKGEVKVRVCYWSPLLESVTGVCYWSLLLMKQHEKLLLVEEILYQFTSKYIFKVKGKITTLYTFVFFG